MHPYETATTTSNLIDTNGMQVKQVSLANISNQTSPTYMRIMTGEAVPVVGIVCSLTNYHCAKVLPDRSAASMLNTFHEIWYRPLGLPLGSALIPTQHICQICKIGTTNMASTM